MSLTIRSIFFLLLQVCCVTGLASSAHAQQLQTERLDDATFTFSISWDLGLQASIDSLGVESLTPPSLRALAGGLLSTSETIALRTLAAPPVMVLSTEYDEVRLPITPQEGTVLEELFLGAARVEGVGLMRKEPVGSLVARFFSYDPSSNTLRRYRHLTVRLSDRPQASQRIAGMRAFVNPHLAVDQSVLADGVVYKIPITEEGIYRIDREFLSDIGLSPDSIDPDNVKVFGNGGAPLPASNSAVRIPDLAEIPVFRRGGGDGTFGTGDAVLFYGRGPNGWRYDTELQQWAHFVHPFSSENYYFLKVDNVAGRIVPLTPFPALPSPTRLSSVQGRFFRDLDELVWSREHGSGHTWVSTQIRVGGRRDLLEDQQLPGLQGGTVTYQARVAIKSNPVATVAFESGSARVGEVTAPAIVFNSAESATARPVITTFNQNVSTGARLNLSMRLLEQNNEPEAALDWLRVFYEKRLQAENDVLRFTTPPGSTGAFEMTLSGFSQSPLVWDVTNAAATRQLTVQDVGGQHRIQIDVTDPAQPRELIAFAEVTARTPASESVTQIPNQNLHGLQNYPDFVIVAPTEFLDQANELADHRRQEGMDVVVSSVDAIYNEFSGGVPDMRATRDYFKFLYDRAPDEVSLLRYALFFGDGHYDFRELSSESIPLSNWIFPYETEDSFVPDQTFTSDDYFGLLDDNEGEWVYTNFRAVSSERMDIGVGRMPVQSVEEAALMVEKIKKYESVETYGPWRSTYTFTADDGPTGLSGLQNDYDLHLQNVDQVAELIRGGLYRDIDIKKIYAESFEREFLNGFRIPGAKQAITNALNNGTLLFNYSGHGGPDGLAQEELFTRQDAEALTNKDRPAIFITATCSFGWWDIETEQSGAEVLLLNPNGGAVALMTTVRLVYTSRDTTSLNAGLNRALNIELFKRDEEGLPSRLGDVMRRTKNTNVGLQGNSRKFNLLGDPTLRVGLPPSEVVVETLNGTALGEQSGQMKALDKVTMTGSVRTKDGFEDSSFNGIVNVTVFDSERNVLLRDQVYMPEPYYTVREDLIWRGEVQVIAGKFTAEFVVPKDISYSNQAGRISAYARSANGHALGANEQFLVGGTSATPPDDKAGPELSLFLNDTTFVSGSLTTIAPKLIVKLFDESGINTVGAGVGHEMLLVVNGDEGNATDISQGFTSEENSYQRGTVEWQLPEQLPGLNTLSVRAWDVLNNSNLTDLEFTVTQNEDLSLRNVFNYPNPMNRNTQFVFEHNQPPGTPAEIRVRIYSLSGRLVRTIDAIEALPSGVLTGSTIQIPWDGLDDDFDRPATGVYLYKVSVQVDRLDGDRQVAEQVEKLALIR